MRLHIRHRTVYHYESGVCQDHAHVFIAAARALGWVGLDPANGSCPGERHVRTSVGLDYASAAPVRSVRRGGGYETLQVGIQVARLAEQ